MAATSIEWSDMVWNPTVGCTRISEGCRFCYAFALHDMRHAAHKNGKQVPVQYAKPFKELQLMPDRIDAPLHWKKPRRIFVNSMSDLFHEDVPDEFLDLVFVTMAMTQQHTYQVLTKRHERMRDYLQSRDLGRIFETEHKEWGGARVGAESSAIQIEVSAHNLLTAEGVRTDPHWPLANVWLGVSVENQEQADKRIPLLLQTPAALRFLSAEPLLGTIDLSEWMYTLKVEHNGDGDTQEVPCRPDIHWVIIGGESGPGARPCNIEWIRDIVQQCKAANVPAFVKQLGSHPVVPHPEDPEMTRVQKRFVLRDKKGGDINEFPKDLRIREFPKERCSV